MFGALAALRQVLRDEEAMARFTPAKLRGAAVDWAAVTGWRRDLVVKADTFPRYYLFEGEEEVRGPKAWRYLNRRLPAGRPLELLSTRGVGEVRFDQDVLIPIIFTTWDPWMSLTPSEYLTLRPGTKMARGRVVVAGLGMGYQLVEVAKRKQVTSIVLVERDQELFNWLWPRIEPLVGRPVEVIIGDAYEVLPRLEAEVALVDIFPGFGHNRFPAATCPGIKRIWCWGGGVQPSGREW